VSSPADGVLLAKCCRQEPWRLGPATRKQSPSRVFARPGYDGLQ